MKSFIYFFTLLSFLYVFSSENFFAQQLSEGESNSLVIPQHIKVLNDKIKYAEDTGDWNSYYNLREQIINEWNKVYPQIADLYKTTNRMQNNGVYNEAPQINNTEGNLNLMKGEMWGNDLMIHSGNADDISLVSARGDTLYASVLKRHFGVLADTIWIYRSPDGGNNWNLFKRYFINLPNQATKVELLDFWGTSGPSYLLMFTLYLNGELWCTRITPTGSSTNNRVVDLNCGDFTVDRNYSASNYRCFVLYDSSGSLYTKRSEPSSYATVWQDRGYIPNCGDGDLAYGYNGSIYATYNGMLSGNLYVLHNYNYADPTGWVNQLTIESGSTDTTNQSEIIASREDTSAQQIALVYTHRNGSTTDLRTAKKIPSSSWGSSVAWVSNASLEFKFANLYSRRENGNNTFQGVFNRSNLSNQTPRYVMYKPYDGTLWASSIIVSDAPDYSTGSQNAVVVELPGEVAAFIYAGSNGQNVYFDREDWITNIQVDGNKIPDNYVLYQNYPNPFNPSTTIKYSVPEQSFVKIKVFNLLGQEIAELVNQELQTGNYEVSFDATNFPSGIYFYRMETGNYIQTRKMILMK